MRRRRLVLWGARRGDYQLAIVPREDSGAYLGTLAPYTGVEVVLYSMRRDVFLLGVRRG